MNRGESCYISKHLETNNRCMDNFRNPSMYLTAKLLCKLLFLPLLIPIMASHMAVKSTKILDAYYTLRSLLHAIPYRQGLRIAKQDENFVIYPTSEDPSFVDVYIRNVYGLYVSNPNDVVFDIGAHMGFFTLKVAKRVKKVIAFEPDPFNIHYLLLNLRINKVSNVDVYRLALGDRKGVVYLRRRYGGGRTEVAEEPTSEKVYMTTIDDFVSSNKTEPTVIKIDTEGYEVNILRGAVNTLARYKPKLIIAAYHYPEEVNEIEMLLRKLRYCIIIYHVPLFLQYKKEVYVFAFDCK